MENLPGEVDQNIDWNLGVLKKENDDPYDLGRLNTMVLRNEKPNIDGDGSLGSRVVLTFNRLKKISDDYCASNELEFRKECSVEFNELRNRLFVLQQKILRQALRHSDKENIGEFFNEKIKEVEEKISGKNIENESELEENEEIEEYTKTLEHVKYAKILALTDLENLTIQNIKFLFSSLSESVQ